MHVWRHMDIWGAYRHMGCIETLGAFGYVGVYGCMGHMGSVQTYEGYKLGVVWLYGDVQGVYRCVRGCTDIQGNVLYI